MMFSSRVTVVHSCPWFDMAKTAQTALMKNLALQKRYARAGITFNSVAPGGIQIPGTGWEDSMKQDPDGYAPGGISGDPAAA